MFEQKMETLLRRFQEVEAKLGDPEVLNDKNTYRDLTREHSHLSELKEVWDKFQKAKNELKDSKELLQEEADPEFVAVLEEEIKGLEETIPILQAKLEALLIPPDPTDHCSTILEIRSGTGGDEAALFVGDCVRMYKLFADKMGWSYEELSSTPSEVGGYKEYVMVLSGQNVYRSLKHEGGTHRVQRVPETETQGRVHTSAVTVATLMEPDEKTEIVIDEKELRIDTYRSSGAGGQHVNTTDSAVRITHLPTGIVVHCQEERSQHKNKDKAMRFLKAKLLEEEERKKHKERADDRALQVGSGDRSERIRTYNFPQNRVTDHRINLTKYNLDRFMEGEMEEVVQALIADLNVQKLG